MMAALKIILALPLLLALLFLVIALFLQFARLVKTARWRESEEPGAGLEAPSQNSSEESSDSLR